MHPHLSQTAPKTLKKGQLGLGCWCLMFTFESFWIARCALGLEGFNHATLSSLFRSHLLLWPLRRLPCTLLHPPGLGEDHLSTLQVQLIPILSEIRIQLPMSLDSSCTSCATPASSRAATKTSKPKGLEAEPLKTLQNLNRYVGLVSPCLVIPKLNKIEPTGISLQWTIYCLYTVHDEKMKKYEK